MPTMLGKGRGMSESDIEYLSRRRAEESRRAEDTSDVAAADIHRRMAALYADRIVSLTDHPGFDPIVQTRPRT